VSTLFQASRGREALSESAEAGRRDRERRERMTGPSEHWTPTYLPAIILPFIGERPVVRGRKGGDDDSRLLLNGTDHAGP